MLAGKTRTEQRGQENQECLFALALTPYFAWALCVRCSPMLFAGATSTRPSYLFLVGLALGAVLLAAAWRLRTARSTGRAASSPCKAHGVLDAYAPPLAPLCA